MNMYARTEALLGEKAFKRLRQLRIMVIGAGGVGSHAAQALAYMGVGSLHLVDFDTLDITNANRHVQAQRHRIGRSKVEALKDHLLETFDRLEIRTSNIYFSEESLSLLDEPVDMVLECIDHLRAKLLIIEQSQRREIPILSALGMGNRLNPSLVHITTLYKTSGCPFAARLRREALKWQLKDTPVVISSETPRKISVKDDSTRHTPASCYLVPAACGNLMAYHVVKTFTDMSTKNGR